MAVDIQDQLRPCIGSRINRVRGRLQRVHSTDAVKKFGGVTVTKFQGRGNAPYAKGLDDVLPYLRRGLMMFQGYVPDRGS